MPHASATIAKEVDLQSNTLSTVSDIIGINTTKYATSVAQSSTDQYKETLQRENLRVTLDSESSTIDILYTYINGKIQKIYVSSGSTNDGQYATVAAAEPYGVIGWICGGLNAQTSGHIYVYGYGSGPVEVYTSAGYQTTLYPSGAAGWIDCGTCTSPFNSITLVARNWATSYIDAVNVQP